MPPRRPVYPPTRGERIVTGVICTLGAVLAIALLIAMMVLVGEWL